jgi:hypothetical protein
MNQVPELHIATEPPQFGRPCLKALTTLLSRVIAIFGNRSGSFSESLATGPGSLQEALQIQDLMALVTCGRLLPVTLANSIQASHVCPPGSKKIPWSANVEVGAMFSGVCEQNDDGSLSCAAGLTWQHGCR